MVFVTLAYNIMERSVMIGINQSVYGKRHVFTSTGFHKAILNVLLVDIFTLQYIVSKVNTYKHTFK